MSFLTLKSFEQQANRNLSIEKKLMEQQEVAVSKRFILLIMISIGDRALITSEGNLKCQRDSQQ